MSKKSRRSLNLSRETLRAMSTTSLDEIAGGALPHLPQLPQSLACITKLTKQIGDTIYRSLKQCPTILNGCSAGGLCA